MRARDCSDTTLKISELCVRYDDKQILDQICLSLKNAEILSVMGASGSGKTTLFRAILGLVPIASGRIEILHQDIGALPRKQYLALRKKIGVAFQSGGLLASLTVAENIALPLREHTSLDHSTIRIMTRMKLDAMGLLDAADKMPSELSGGMMKRASLARAVIMDPRLLLFDEPSAGLDPVTAAELDELILMLREVFGMSVVVVTHDIHSTFAIADRTIVLDEGKQLLTGSPELIRASKDQRIINMRERKSTGQDVDANTYLDRLTG